MDFLTFCESFIHLHGRRICFDHRPYLPPIYAATGNLVLRCSRQVEKSTFLANLMIYQCIRRPHTTILFICPRDEQARAFSRGRLIDTIDQSPVAHRLLLMPKSRPAVKFLEFINGSRIYIRPAFRTADACRGLSADTLVIDEFQDVADGAVSTVFGRVKYKKIRFPRAGDIASYLDEMACEIAVYNEEQRSTRYKCPEGRFDDALHALAYLTCLATREYHIRGQY